MCDRSTPWIERAGQTGRRDEAERSDEEPPGDRRADCGAERVDGIEAPDERTGVGDPLDCTLGHQRQGHAHEDGRHQQQRDVEAELGRGRRERDQIDARVQRDHPLPDDLKGQRQEAGQREHDEEDAGRPGPPPHGRPFWWNQSTSW
jgi:hypothetical protein